MKKMLTLLMMLLMVCSSFQYVKCADGYIEREHSRYEYQQIVPPSDQISEKADARIETIKSGFVTICSSLFAVSFIVFLLLIFFCKNDKNLSLYLKILGTIIVTILIVLLISNGTINSLVEHILGLFGF